MPTTTVKTPNKGDKFTTIHEEELTVLDVKTIPVMRQKKPTGDTMIMILAKSGDQNTWFPITRIKENKEGGSN